MNSDDAVRSLAALAQATRLAIYRLLVAAGVDGLTVARIGESMAVAPATLSFHLKELSNAGLIASRQDGRFIWYSANYAAMNGLLAYLSDNCCNGQPALCAPASCTPKTAKARRSGTARPAPRARSRATSTRR